MDQCLDPLFSKPLLQLLTNVTTYNKQMPDMGTFCCYLGQYHQRIINASAINSSNLLATCCFLFQIWQFNPHHRSLDFIQTTIHP